MEKFVNKSELRKKHLNLRNAMSKSEVVENSANICRHILGLKCVQEAKNILMYYPLGNEVDLTSLQEIFAVTGKRVFLPIAQGDEMFIGEWKLGVSLSKGEYGIMVPQINENEASDGEQGKLCRSIDVVLVPGIVFDKKGNRVGFGKGYYDRFLVKTRPDCAKVAVCYENQFLEGEGREELLFREELQLIDAEPQDVKMEYIVTEKGVKDFTVKL